MRLILVTGSPRSATTAVGQVLSAARATAGLHEPFNYHVGLRSVPHYFIVPGAGGVSHADLDRMTNEIRALDLRFKPGVFPNDPTPRRVMKRLLGGRALNSYRRARFTPGLRNLIWKDPFAAFAAAELSDRHEAIVVVTVRSPWAVAASFKRMGWAFDLAALRKRLIEAGHVVHAADPTGAGSNARNGALLWRMVYDSLMDAAATRGDFVFVDIDDVVGQPVDAYRRIYARTGLEWTRRSERLVAKMYRARDAGGAPETGKAHDRARDISAVNTYWRKLLTQDEIDYVNDVAIASWQRVREMIERRDATP